MDDSEYSTRFNRLDGLTAQLAFSIRKSWKTVPSWLAGSVNKDAIITGKQEMTAAGRAFISCWLVEEVFDKYFHPDLDPTLSAQLKAIHKTIRKVAPPSPTPEEEEFLTQKTVNWRLTTLEGLQEMLRSPQCSNNRTSLMDMLKEHLIGALQVHLQDPPMSDLEGGVHMIIELAVSMATHLPLESRDVQIDYFMPGVLLGAEFMKIESGIPALGTSVAEDAADRTSTQSVSSDHAAAGGGAESSSSAASSSATGTTGSTAGTDTSSITSALTQSVAAAAATDALNPSSWKRGMLSALTGTTKTKSHAAQGKHAATAGGSTGSLDGRPNSAGGSREKEDPNAPARVRMSVGIGAQVRGKVVLVKAPVFGTQYVANTATGRD